MNDTYLFESYNEAIRVTKEKLGDQVLVVETETGGPKYIGTYFFHDGDNCDDDMTIFALCGEPHSGLEWQIFDMPEGYQVITEIGV